MQKMDKNKEDRPKEGRENDERFFNFTYFRVENRILNQYPGMDCTDNAHIYYTPPILIF